MVYTLHDTHLLVDLRIDDSILHKPALLDLLGCELVTSILIGQEINSRKSTFANNMLLVVLSSTSPLLGTVADQASARGNKGVVLVCKEIRLTQVSR